MSTPVPTPTPIQRGFEYEVRRAVAIPLAWARLLKVAAEHHYDARCRASGDHGTVNGLYNTACDGKFPSTLPVSWSDLDLTVKVAEQLEYHTKDRGLIQTIRTWVRETMSAIEQQRQACLTLPGSRSSSVDADEDPTALTPSEKLR